MSPDQARPPAMEKQPDQPGTSPSGKAEIMIPVIIGLIPALFLLQHLDLPMMEDSLFWWLPQAHIVAERGLSWAPSGDLPAACRPELPLPPQWAGGIPDYGHPPLWSAWLGLGLRLFGASVPSPLLLHLLCLPFVLLASGAMLALSRRLGGGWLAALPALLCPAALLQTLRPDSDLPLLALSLLSLVAAIDRRPILFLLFSSLAVWTKEPALLLLVPAAWVALRERSFRLVALAPALALALWALVHHFATGWALAGSERLPESLPAYLRDLGAVLSIVWIEGGRWLLTVLAGGILLLAFVLGRRPGQVTRLLLLGAEGPEAWTRRRADGVILSFLIVQVLFFAGVNFLGGRQQLHSFTHVRYLLPAITCGSLWAASLLLRGGQGILAKNGPQGALWGLLPPTLLLLALLPVKATSRVSSPRGPEANLVGRDLALAWREALPHLQELEALPSVEEATIGPVYVESYLFTALTRPFAGLVEAPLLGVQPFGLDTDPAEIPAGARIVLSSHGEPLGRLGELQLLPDTRFSVGDTWVEILSVQPGRAAAEGRNR